MCPEGHFLLQNRLFLQFFGKRFLNKIGTTGLQYRASINSTRGRHGKKWLENETTWREDGPIGLLDDYNVTSNPSNTPHFKHKRFDVPAHITFGRLLVIRISD